MYFSDPQNPTVFTGYDTVESRSHILSIIYNDRYEEHVILKEGEMCKIIVDISPFFPLGNSQISDTGWIHNDNIMLKVLDVNFTNEGIFFHSVECKQPGSLRQGDKVFTHIDTLRRQEISRNHTAAHLLYAALRDELGDKIDGYSSFASCDKLCFDFFCPSIREINSVPSEKQICSLEKRVYSNIILNNPVLTFMTSMEKAREICSVKSVNHNRKVRICQIDDISCEICEGTHCIYTGEIGALKITSSFTGGDGFFRLEAITVTSEQ
jgi:alanyl-tRNA synthetase